MSNAAAVVGDVQLALVSLRPSINQPATTSSTVISTIANCILSWAIITSARSTLLILQLQLTRSPSLFSVTVRKLGVSFEASKV